jgi:hypothetical protein
MSIRLDQASFFTQFRSALISALASSISFRMSAVVIPPESTGLRK